MDLLLLVTAVLSMLGIVLAMSVAGIVAIAWQRGHGPGAVEGPRAEPILRRLGRRSTLGGFQCRVRRARDAFEKPTATGYVLEVLDLPRDLALKAPARPVADQPRIGDATVDDQFVLAARDGAVARLTQPAREALVALRPLARSVRLERGTLQVHGHDADRILALRPTVEAFVTQLDRRDRRVALRSRITDDPDPRVRATLLLQLSHLDPREARSLASTLGDSPEEQLVSGQLLDDTRRLFLAIRPLPRGSLDISRRAARELGRRGCAPEPILTGLQRAHRSAGLVIGLEALDDSEALHEALCRRLGDAAALLVRPERPRRRPLLTLLPRLRHRSIEPVQGEVLDLLSHDDEEIRRAALGLLAQQGTVPAIPRLATFRDTLPTFPGTLRGRVQSVIRAIQARSEGTVGGLALAEIDGARGALSEPTDDARGRLGPA